MSESRQPSPDTFTDERGRTYVEFHRLRCPVCASLALTPQEGKKPNGDGTFSRRQVCNTCEEKFTAIII